MAKTLHAAAAIVTTIFLVACAQLDPTGPVVFSPPLTDREAQVMREMISSGQAASLRFTRDEGAEWFELLPIIDGRAQRATPAQGQDIQSSGMRRVGK